MESRALNILLIEDNLGDAELIREMAKEFETMPKLVLTERLSSGLRLLEEDSFDIVLLDLGLPDSEGIHSFRTIHHKGPKLPVVVLTGLSDKEVAAKAMSIGAQDYLVKGTFDTDLLYRSILYSIERKRFQQQLADSEERFRRAVTDAAFPAMIHAEDGAVIQVNRMWTALSGYRHDQIPTTEEWVKKAYPENSGKKTAYFRKLYDIDALIEEGEDVITASSGERRTWDFSSAPLGRLSNGRRLVITMAHDVTDRKYAEEALRRSHEELEQRVQERTAELRKTVEALEESRNSLAKAQALSHIGSWKWDFQTGTITWSDEMYRIFGVRPEEFSTSPEAIMPLVHPDDRGKMRKRIEFIMAEHQPHPLEYRIIRPDGAERHVWTEGEAIRDESGKSIALIGTVQDLTERRRAEEERIRLATVVESTVEAVIITDTRGIIQYVNPAFTEITRYSRDEAVGRDLHILDSGKHDKAFYQALRETLSRDGVWSGHLINKKKDGTLYDEECIYSPIKNASGRVMNYVSIRRDITEKLRLESIAQAVDTMNNIGSIFTGVRHELANPVNSINMILGMLKEKLPNLDKAAIENYIDRSLEQIARVNYLLTILKNFNLYEKPELQYIPVKELLDTLMPLVKEDFKRKGIEVTSWIDPHAQFCYGDPRALQQALINLLMNAADAVRDRETPRIGIRAIKRNDAVLIRVEDNGCGMTDEQQKNLFKPFYTSKPHGTGLGLVLVKKMVAAMRGTLEVFSRKDAGTAVEITIPEGATEKDFRN